MSSASSNRQILPDWVPRDELIYWIAQIAHCTQQKARRRLPAVTEELRDNPANFRLGLPERLDASWQAGPLESWDGIEKDWDEWLVTLSVDHRLASGGDWEGGKGWRVIAREFGLPYLQSEDALRLLNGRELPLEVSGPALKAAVELVQPRQAKGVAAAAAYEAQKGPPVAAEAAQHGVEPAATSSAEASAAPKPEPTSAAEPSEPRELTDATNEESKTIAKRPTKAELKRRKDSQAKFTPAQREEALAEFKRTYTGPGGRDKRWEAYKRDFYNTGRGPWLGRERF